MFKNKKLFIIIIPVIAILGFVMFDKLRNQNKIFDKTICNELGKVWYKNNNIGWCYKPEYEIRVDKKTQNTLSDKQKQRQKQEEIKNCPVAAKNYNSGDYTPEKAGDLCRNDDDCMYIDCDCSGLTIFEGKYCDQYCQCRCECILGDDFGS